MNLDKIQKIETNILENFVKYLDKLKFSYLLCGGTLLGAVRHNGFIPWDDDIDIYVRRDEYDKLIDIAKNNQYFGDNNEFKIAYPGEKGYLYPFIKIFDTRYPAKDPALIDTYRIYIYIDVFPLDHLPEDDNIRYDFVKRSKKMRYLLYSRTFKREKTSSSKIKWVLKFLLLKLFGGEETLAKKIDDYGRKINKKYFNSSIMGNGSWPNGVNDYYPKGSIGKTKEYDFEGKKYIGPEDADSYLKNFYGDYMTLPPIEKRVSHSIEII